MRFSSKVTLAIMSITASGIAGEVRAADREPTKIGAQDLEPALQMLATERDIKLVYPDDLVRERRTDGTNGELTVDEALTGLLSGTGLSFQHLQDRSIAIVAANSEPEAPAPTQATQPERVRLAQAPPASPGPAAAAAVPAESDRVEIQQVIVTAQKRAENAQNVPIAVDAIDAEALEHSAPALNTTNLQQFVPGLVMGRSGTAGATFLRGVGTESGVTGTESPIATYLDGIYLGVNSLALFELNNVQQISVLKGPQGTLFGRNAAGGAIQITTKDPLLTKSEINTEVGYGNYDTRTVNFYGSLPLTDTLAANLSVLYLNRGDGTVHNLFTGHYLEAEGEFAAQSKVLWQPDDATQIKLNLIHTHGNQLPGLNYFVQQGAVSQDGQTVYVGPHNVNLFTDERQSADSSIGALTASHDFSWSRLTNTFSRTSYSNRSFNDQSMTTGLPNPGNIAPSNADLNADVDEWTDELQLQSLDGAPVTWIGGLFYFNDHTHTLLQSFNYPNGVQTPGYGLHSELTTASYAAYAQATKEILSQTNLTLGLRYTRDDKGLSGATVYGQTVSASLPPEETFDKLTWRFALDHHFTDNLMSYLSYNRGFRSGAYSATSLTNPAAKPETLDAYELGLKSEWLDRTIRVNASAFFYDYQDLQIRINVGSPVTALIENAARAQLYGVDFDFEAQPTRNLRLFAGVEGLHSEYTSFPNGTGNYPVGVAQLGRDPITTAPPGCEGTPRLGAGGISTNLQCDLSGNEVINAPKFSASYGLEYTEPTAVGTFSLTLTDKYTGKSFATADNFQVLDAYHSVDASLGWTSINDHYYAKLWGTNLANSGRPAQLAFSLNTYEFIPNDPLFFGVTVGLRF